MIQDGDKILIGLSGGKDSLFLTYALANLKIRLARNFSLVALTVDPKFTNDFQEKISALKNFCSEFEIEYLTEEVDINGAIHSAENKHNPCFTCAFFRRGAINRVAKKIGANKIAYAHHLDDAVETFFMSLLSSGQLTTFLPKTFLSRTNLTVILPLVYLREKEISNFAAKKKLPVLKSPCPIDGTTNRQTVKNLIVELGKIYPDLFDRLTAAMRKSSIVDLWDAPLSKSEMREIYFSYIHQNRAVGSPQL